MKSFELSKLLRKRKEQVMKRTLISLLVISMALIGYAGSASLGADLVDARDAQEIQDLIDQAKAGDIIDIEPDT